MILSEQSIELKNNYIWSEKIYMHVATYPPGSDGIFTGYIFRSANKKAIELIVAVG